ncbi:MAG: hypothetical protein HYX20_01210 [Candidatus Yanofskybacteria bacterium]|nr:hypothetical protein [Candidatus Yanofskybacteria bacterium]
MSKEIPEWKKQLLEKEPQEEHPSLDTEALAPYKEKIKILERDLAALDNFLNLHFDAKTKPQKYDFVEVYKNINVLAPPQIDPTATALSDDILERILVYMANRLRYPPLVMEEILNELGDKEDDKPLKQVFEYVKTLYLGMVENKKKVLWQLTEHVGIKKSAAIFEEQDLIKERAYPDFLDYLDQNLKPEDKKWLGKGSPEAVETARSVFNDWYENNKNKFFLGHEKIRGEIVNIAGKLDDKTAYKIIEKHLFTNPREIFELFESQAELSPLKRAFKIN